MTCHNLDLYPWYALREGPWTALELLWHLCDEWLAVPVITIELLVVAATGAAHGQREDHVGAGAALVGGSRAHRPLSGRPLQQRRHAGGVIAVHGLQV